MRLLSILILAMFLTTLSYGNTSSFKDSLLQKIAQTKNDSLRIQLTNELSFNLIFNDIRAAKKYIEKGIIDSRKTKNDFGYSQLLLTKGIYFDVQGTKDSAEYYFKEGLNFSRKKKFLNIEMMALNNLGMFYWGKGSFEQALKHFVGALSINKRSFPEKKESRANYESNIGLIYQELRQFDQAIRYHKAALKQRIDLNLKSAQAISQANLGLCYSELKQLKMAEEHIRSAIRLSEESGNLRLFYSLHDNLGTIYSKSKRFQEAIKSFETALNRPDDIGLDPKSDLSISINLSSLYNQMGSPNKANAYIERSKQIAQQHPELYPYTSGLYLADAESKFLLGDLSGGRNSIEKYREITDSIFSKNNAIALAESIKKYELLENELTIAEQKQKLNAQALNVQRALTWWGISVGGLLIFILILFYYFKRRSHRAQQRQLELSLSLQEEVMRSQQERLRISRELHDNIGSYLTLMSATAEQLESPIQPNDALINLKESISSSMRELRRTVWLFNQQSAHVDEIAVKMRDFFRPYQQNNRTIEVLVHPESESVLLSDIQTTHVFRIIQEAVNNAVKYSNCSSIIISFFSIVLHELSFSIKDNGIGFDENETNIGNGIKNMRSRISELDGVMRIDSNSNGTVLLFSFRYENTK
jgi:signal transduction histidine kinase/Tfp pilus assembly protein PilF